MKMIEVLKKTNNEGTIPLERDYILIVFCIKCKYTKQTFLGVQWIPIVN